MKIHKKYNKKATKRPENSSNGRGTEVGRHWQACDKDTSEGQIHTQGREIHSPVLGGQILPEV
jgi:hypothetical protein